MKSIKKMEIIKNKKIFIPVAIFILFIITNPSLKAFKAHQGVVSYAGLSRQYNFFVCSIYNDTGSKYFAILGNFFSID